MALNSHFVPTRDLCQGSYVLACAPPERWEDQSNSAAGRWLFFMIFGGFAAPDGSGGEA
jgi:hypothetical protein